MELLECVDQLAKVEKVSRSALIMQALERLNRDVARRKGRVVPPYKDVEIRLPHLPVGEFKEEEIPVDIISEIEDRLKQVRRQNVARARRMRKEQSEAEK
ncbi:MAG: hypothetical protein J1E42_04575 [Akkermansiaceae bacterium]|nr:hypothetical protein [Akkermansiaceae bacterium]